MGAAIACAKYVQAVLISAVIFLTLRLLTPVERETGKTTAAMTNRGGLSCAESDPRRRLNAGSNAGCHAPILTPP